MEMVYNASILNGENIMPVPSKIQDIEKLRECYVDKKMSTTAIAKKSEELLGVKVSPSSVYNSIVKAGIPLRSKSESVSIATSTLDRDNSFENEDMIAWTDGFLLGDGNVNYSHGGNSLFVGARFNIGSSQSEWSSYSMSGFGAYNPTEPKDFGKRDKKHPNPIYYSRTLTHPDIIDQAKRWYPEGGKKRIPIDVRITPVSVMLWYLGDGSFTYQKKSNAGVLRLHTCDFTVDDMENILIPKMEAVGLSCWRDPHKGDLHISSNCIRLFFDFIGNESPIECYAHKFEIPEWLGMLRLSDIVKDKQEKWRVTKWIKDGKIECTKSPGGRLFLFSETQAAALRLRLDS